MNSARVSTEDTGQTVIIHLPPSADDSIKEEVESNISTWLVKSQSVFFLDLNGTTTLGKQVLGTLVRFSKTLRTHDKKFMSYGANQEIVKELKRDGLDLALGLMTSKDEALKNSGLVQKKKVQLDSNIINPFINATINTFKVQLQTEVTAGKLFIKDDKQNLQVGIAGLISLVCNEFSGTICVAFPTPVFLKIYETMLGEKAESITAETQDAAGEILNIIYGQGKTELVNKGYKLERALPTVLAGDNLKVFHSKQAKIIAVPFKASFGEFYFEISLEE